MSGEQDASRTPATSGDGSPEAGAPAAAGGRDAVSYTPLTLPPKA